jgi:hypothetical protein
LVKIAKKIKLDISQYRLHVVQVKFNIYNDKEIWPSEEESHNNSNEYNQRIKIKNIWMTYKHIELIRSLSKYF